MVRYLGKKALTNIAKPLATDNLPGLVSNLTWNVINKFEVKALKFKVNDRVRITKY